MPPVFINIDPRTLRVPGSRPGGADPDKLKRQIASFGSSAVGMPPIWVYRGTDDEMVIFNGVTRATRIATLAPGKAVCIEVVGNIRRPFGSLPTIGDLIP